MSYAELSCHREEGTARLRVTRRRKARSEGPPPPEWSLRPCGQSLRCPRSGSQQETSSRRHKHGSGAGGHGQRPSGWVCLAAASRLVHG